MPLEQYLPLQVYGVLMVLARSGTTVFLIPGIGETFVPNKVRILFALGLAIAIAPVIGPNLPPEPATPAGLLMLLLGEVVIGVYFGLVARLLLLTLDTTGRIIAFSSGLANAQAFNPALSEQGSLPGLFLTTLGIMLLFATNMHHMLIRAIVDSYEVFPVGGALPLGDLSDALARLVSGSFRVAVQLAAPYMVISLLFFAALGVLARLMPQLQIFFIGLPVQMALGFAITATILGGLMGLFLEYYATNMADYLVLR
ncbi:MAG: flagellar type III secretion system protein FliR [Alphaproteobacteria bacterium]|nr:flagellar type III secretion system protein FliR [Alphaproteobacteria bacterium]